MWPLVAPRARRRPISERRSRTEMIMMLATPALHALHVAPLLVPAHQRRRGQVVPEVVLAPTSAQSTIMPTSALCRPCKTTPTARWRTTSRYRHNEVGPCHPAFLVRDTRRQAWPGQR